MKICKQCGEYYECRVNSVYCGVNKTMTCAYCGKTFEKICGKRKIIGCSLSCSKKIVSEANKVKKKCKNCEEYFLGGKDALYIVGK